MDPKLIQKIEELIQKVDDLANKLPKTTSLVPEWVSIAILLVAVVILTLIAAVILIRLITNKEAGEMVAKMLSEQTTDNQKGKPSVSRLQMLIWNFVLAFAFLYVLGTVKSPNGFKDVVDGFLSVEVLALLGLSNGTYWISKLTSPKTKKTQPEGNQNSNEDPIQNLNPKNDTHTTDTHTS